MLYPNELVISDANFRQHQQPPTGYANGGIPRNYFTHPIGCYGGILPYYAVDMTVFPRSEWPDRIKDQTANKSRCSDIRLSGNAGQPIPSRDQNGKGYCWMHSGVSALLVTRAAANLPYEDLSAYGPACVIKNFRDEGGWGPQGVDFLMARGCPTSKTWAQQSMSKANDNAATWAEAAKYKISEGWIDLQAAQYDRNLTFDQNVTLSLVGQTGTVDFNWWSHSVCRLDVVDGNSMRDTTRNEAGKLMNAAEADLFWGLTNPVTAGYGLRIWNSWGETWSDRGMGILTGNQAIPDASVGVRTATISP